MLIVLDSTALRQYLPFDSPLFRQLETFVKANGHRLVVPQVVHRELKEHIASEFRKIDQAFIRFERQTRYRGEITPPGEAEQEQLTASLDRRLSELEAEVMPVPPIPHEIVIDRIYERKAPFRQSEKNKDAGYKDFLIWNTVLELARTNSGQEVVLITADGDFRKDGELHPDLATDADGLNVRLVNDLTTFHEAEVRPWFSSDEGMRNQLEQRLDEIRDFIGEEIERISVWLDVDASDIDPLNWSRHVDLSRVVEVASVRVTDVTRLNDRETVASLVLHACFTFGDLYSVEHPWQLGVLDDAGVEYDETPLYEDSGIVSFNADGIAHFDIVLRIENDEIQEPTAISLTNFAFCEPILGSPRYAWSMDIRKLESQA